VPHSRPKDGYAAPTNRHDMARHDKTRQRFDSGVPHEGIVFQATARLAFIHSSFETST